MEFIEPALNVLGTYGLPILIIMALWHFLMTRVWPFVENKAYPDSIRQREDTIKILKSMSEAINVIMETTRTYNADAKRLTDDITELKESTARIEALLPQPKQQRDRTEPKPPQMQLPPPGNKNAPG